MAKIWWVNQGQSVRLGHEYNEIWAPLLNEKKKPEVTWERLQDAQPGDLVLHYARGFIRGFSTVLAPARTDARPFDVVHWNNDGRQLDVDFAALDTPISLNDIPLGARLSEPKPHAAFNVSGGVNQGYFYPLSLNLAEIALALADVKIEIKATAVGDTIFINGATDRVGLAKFRVEQPQLRKNLINGRSEAECGICGVEYPIGYLITAHIKKRSDCSENERIDPNVVMLACLFGCDAAFERGQLRVDSRGRISVHALASSVSDRFADLSGKTAQVFSTKNKRYFVFHDLAHSAK